MKLWKIFNILFSLCLLINCEKSFDPIVPQKSDPRKPPKPPIIIRTAPPSANLMFSRGDTYGDGDIYFLDILGVETRLTFEGIAVNVFGDPPVFSPDGSKIAFVSEKEGNPEIYIMNSDGSNQINLTNHPAGDYFPKFSPDGSYFIFVTNRAGNWEIYSMSLDGSNKTNLTRCVYPDVDPTFSPDGSKIAFISARDTSYNYAFGADVFIMDVDGSNQRNLTAPSRNNKPLFSPDGLKILFARYRDFNGHLYIMNSDGTNQKHLLIVVSGGIGNGAEIAKHFTYDGNQIIYEQREIFDDTVPPGIYTIDINGQNCRLLSRDDRHPCLSPDGSKIVFISHRDGYHKKNNLYQMNIDGTDQVRLTDSTSFDQWPIYQPVQR